MSTGFELPRCLNVQRHQDMLTVVGLLLQDTVWAVKGLTFDAHQSHTMFRRALFGQFHGDLTRELLSTLPFWQDLTWVALPEHALPRLPAQVCIHDHSALWPLPGACALTQYIFDSF